MNALGVYQNFLVLYIFNFVVMYIRCSCVLYCLPYLELYHYVISHTKTTRNSFSFLLRSICLWSTLRVECLTKPTHLYQFFCVKLTNNKIDVIFFGFLDANISKMYQGTIPLMAFNFWKFLFRLHRKSDEGPNEKKQQQNISIIYNICIYIYMYRYIDIYI